MRHKNDNTAIRFERLAEYIQSVEGERTALAELNRELSQYNNNESDLTVQQNTVQSDINKIRLELDELIQLKKEREHLEKTISDNKRDQTLHKRSIEEQKLELHKLDATIKQYGNTRPPTTKSQSYINDALKEVKSREEQHYAAIGKSKKIQKDLEPIQGRLQNHTIHEISNTILNLESKINSDNSQLSDIQNQFTTKNRGLGALRQEVKTLTKSLNRALDLGSRCDVCESELDPTNVSKLKNTRQSKLDTANEKITATENHMKTLQSQESDMVRQIQTNTKSLDEYRAMERDKAEETRLQDELQALSVDMKPITPEDYVVDDFLAEAGESAFQYLRRLSDASSKYDHDMDILAEKHRTKATLETNLDNTQKLYQETLQKIESNQDHLHNVTTKISESDGVEARHTLMQNKKSKIDQEIKAVLQKISTICQRIKFTKGEIARLDSEIVTAKEHKAKYDLYSDNIVWLENYYIPSVVAIEKKTKITLRYDFDTFYKKWYDILVDDPTKSSFINEKFGPVLSQDGYDLSISGLSGGEKTSVALAYRLALNDTIRRQTNILKSNLLILDEPTDGFSRHQMEKVRTIFEHLHCEQIIMVSHETEMEGYVENVFRVTKAAGVSSIQHMQH